MRKIEELKFYFFEWSFGTLLLVVFCFLFIAAFALNVPAGEEEHIRGEVVELGITNNSKMSASYGTARVRLKSGAAVDVVLPRDVVLKKGEEIIILKQGLFLKGAFYKYVSTAESS